MKKLYENIEDIHIKGGIDQLSVIVKEMDISLQNIASYSEQLTGFLARYSRSNKGARYDKVVKTSIRLRDYLFEASMEMNDMQNQIVEYQNKIYRYEDMSESAAKPNPYLVSKRQVNVDTTVVQFNRTEMIELVASLNNYREKVHDHIRRINHRKNSLASIWLDSQYSDFAEFIDEITKNIVDALKEYGDYVNDLDEKIKELG